MSKAAIQVDGLSKRYRIGARERYRTLRDTVSDVIAAPYRSWKNSRNGTLPAAASPRHLWALKSVSLEIKRGDIVGIIGRNGSGKSTLLKIFSRITEPTEGTVALHGTVGSLLEVGTGFHPELTGRENIYLNGAILGMKRAAIDRSFDEIVEFAEVGALLDTPVKHYSSGQHVRLAFAVAANLDSTILLVDEVLAVGDLAFQKKCLGKLGNVARSGRTICLVSHQLSHIRRLCNTSLWLQNGTVRAYGPTAEVSNAYEASMSDASASESRDNNQPARFIDWELNTPGSEHTHSLSEFEPATVTFTVDVTEPLNGVFHGISLMTSDGNPLWGHGTHGMKLAAGRHRFVYQLPALPLKSGSYRWLVSLHGAGGLIDLWEALPVFQVSMPPFNQCDDQWSGVLNFPFTFSNHPD
jgi:lipopolysaccharide transport system ATP-binding protein